MITSIPPNCRFEYNIDVGSKEQPRGWLFCTGLDSSFQPLQVTTPPRAPIWFIKKEDDSLHLCVDYHGFNIEVMTHN